MIKIMPYKNNCDICKTFAQIGIHTQGKEFGVASRSNPEALYDMLEIDPHFPVQKNCQACGALRLNNGSYLHKETLLSFMNKWNHKSSFN
jgi:hypothetical protein